MWFSVNFWRKCEYNSNFYHLHPPKSNSGSSPGHCHFRTKHNILQDGANWYCIWNTKRKQTGHDGIHVRQMRAMQNAQMALWSKFAQNDKDLLGNLKYLTSDIPPYLKALWRSPELSTISWSATFLTSTTNLSFSLKILFTFTWLLFGRLKGKHKSKQEWIINKSVPGFNLFSKVV